MNVAVMNGWISQWYRYAPEPKSCASASPSPAITPVSKTPKLAVAVCPKPSLLCQHRCRSSCTTVVASDGSNEEPSIAIVRSQTTPPADAGGEVGRDTRG